MNILPQSLFYQSVLNKYPESNLTNALLQQDKIYTNGIFNSYFDIYEKPDVIDILNKYLVSCRYTDLYYYDLGVDKDSLEFNFKVEYQVSSSIRKLVKSTLSIQQVFNYHYLGIKYAIEQKNFELYSSLITSLCNDNKPTRGKKGGYRSQLWKKLEVLLS